MAKTIKKPTTTVKKAVSKKITPPTVETKIPQTKICVYRNDNLKISPRKLRLLANSIKKLPPQEVIVKLSFTNTNAARILSKAIKTVVSSAKNNYNLSESSLKFDSIIVNEGQKIKRMDKSHGSRFARGIIIKRHSRLVITLKGQTA